AILALSTFGPKASGAVPLLIQKLTAPDEYVRAAADVALARITPACPWTAETSLLTLFGGPAEEAAVLMVENLPDTKPSPADQGNNRESIQLTESVNPRTLISLG